MSTVTEISKVHVGCGPKALLPGWWNTDLRPFDGIDEALDATQPWPWDGLTHVYAEHFIEHLEIDQAFAFLTHAGNSLAPGGRIRLSTPNLAWVMLTHFAQQTADIEQRLTDTLRTNRAFHGWGHRFLWSEEMLVALLTTMGYEDVGTFAYGESNDPELRGIERHGGYSVVEGQPSVIIVEAVRGAAPIGVPEGIAGWVDHEFLRHVRAGH